MLALAQPALALVYVPGQYREDGIYIRPHFKTSKTRLDEAWFEELANPLAANTDKKSPPAATDRGKAKGAPEAGH